MNKNLIYSFIGGVALGGTVGWFLARKHFSSQFQDAMEDEVRATREFYVERLQRAEMKAQAQVDLDKPEPSELLRTRYSDALDRLGYGIDDPEKLERLDRILQEAQDIVLEDVEEEESETEEETRNVFDDTIDEEPGDPTRPYLISKDDYHSIDELGFEKVTVTYFDEDDTLVDSQNRIIPDIDRFIGDDSLTKFGRKSGDNLRVYIRNERREVDVEVILDHRSYVTAILGASDPDPEDVKGPLRMREDD